MTVVLVHGWGFDPSVWDGVRRALPHGVPVQTLDLGFFGAEPSGLPTAPALVVGHSFGVQWVLSERPDLAPRLLSINGFARFTAAPDFPEGVPPRLVDRMLARLRQDPEEVLNTFRARCGAGPADRSPELDRLTWGLEALRHGDARPARCRAALAGTADPIVSEAMSRALWGEEINFPSAASDGGNAAARGVARKPRERSDRPALEGQNLHPAPNTGHLLPLTHPDVVAAFIMDHLE